MNIILIGPPGCGKGTQADEICRRYKLKYHSTGNLIREEIAKKSTLGTYAKSVIERGELLDDETILRFVKKDLDGISKKKVRGILFDGFPRKISQAVALEQFSPADIVLDIQVSDTEVIRRISHRWMVEKEHSQFTFVSKHDAEEFVKIHGGHMFHRKDDTPAVIKNRLQVYHTQTQPIIDFYGKKHKLFIINGEKSISQVTTDIFKILDARIKN